VVNGRRPPLPDGVFLARGAFERPNRRIDVTVRENMHELHRAMAFRASRRRNLDIR
jgi:hypothetical protein